MNVTIMWKDLGDEKWQQQNMSKDLFTFDTRFKTNQIAIELNRWGLRVMLNGTTEVAWWC